MWEETNKFNYPLSHITTGSIFIVKANVIHYLIERLQEVHGEVLH